MLYNDEAWPFCRTDEGVFEEGCSLVGLLLMMRSSVTQQRVAACKVLSRVLQQAVPSARDVTVDGRLLSRPVDVPQTGKCGMRGTGACFASFRV